MTLLDRAAKLEKALLDRFGRRTDVARHPIELYEAILDDIEDATEPTTRGGRIFPYTHVVVSLPTADARQRAAAEAVFTDPPTLVERVRTRLRQAGCRDLGDIHTSLKLIDTTKTPWTGGEYGLEFRRDAATTRAPGAKPRPGTAHELHLTVVTGTARKSRYTLDAARINLGRLADVVDRHQRIVRQNQVAFADNEDDVCQSISRAHAHIGFDRARADARIHDDGSTHGTRLVRGARTINVPAGGGRGVTLRDGDEIVLGRARLRVEIRPTRRR